MATHLEVPAPVTALLGHAAVEHTGEGAGRVLVGNGLVAKIGPEDGVAREAAVLALGSALPLVVPEVVASGSGWLVTREVADREEAWTDVELAGAVADLARLHDSFPEGPPPAVSGVLRQPFSERGADALLAPGRQAAYGLPSDLARLLGDPRPLLSELRRWPVTLLHGDPWPGNVRRSADGRRTWLDWEQASAGPAAADVASWLDQTPWHIGREIDTDAQVDAYLASRRFPLHPARFNRALDAASVLWFLAFDLPRLEGAPPELARRVVAGKTEAARVLGGLDQPPPVTSRWTETA